jgi:peptide/nickel transport system permease protein
MVYFRYALKATLIPMMTIIGLTYGFMLGGSVVVEYVYDWPGLGGYVVGAITQNDFPAVMGVTLFLATIYLTINLIVDLLYFVVDPRLQVS